MKTVELGKTGIHVSRLGFGTGTAHPSGHTSQSLMDRNSLARLLLYARERGINFWDTAAQYKTQAHIREALRQVPRTDIVVSTKIIATTEAETLRSVTGCLAELGCDYIDVCLLHAVRSKTELENSFDALNTLVHLKKQGTIRAVGISCHGLSALQAVVQTEEIGAVWARINYAGYLMDTGSPGRLERLASVSWIKKAAALAPKRIVAALRPPAAAGPLTQEAHRQVTDTLQQIHSRSKGTVGMKLLAEGALAGEAEKAVAYTFGLDYIDACIIGMMNQSEVDQNCRIVEGLST